MDSLMELQKYSDLKSCAYDAALAKVRSKHVIASSDTRAVMEWTLATAYERNINQVKNDLVRTPCK